MTREDAIKAVKEITGMSLDWDDRHYDALQLAIKAMSAEGDYISRSDAIEAVASADVTNGTVKVFSGLEVIDILKALPSAEAVQGEWIDTEFLKLKECSCCHCRWGVYDVEDFDYCPSCGAKMFREDGEDNGED